MPGRREGTARADEHLDQLAPARGVALTVVDETGGDGGMEIVSHPRTLPGA